MATRPVFVPEKDPANPRLVHEHEVDFQWEAGAAPEQKQANIAKLHAAAAHRNLSPLLDVSPLSDDPVGAQLSVPRLAVKDENSYFTTVTALYHGSMVFNGGGPFTDLYRVGDQEAATDPRLKDSGRLAGFRFQDLEWGLKAQVMFYDWLVVQAINRHRKLGQGIRKYAGFTDIGCPSKDSGICHARSCALYVSLAEKDLVDQVLASQNLFIETLMRDPFFQS